MNSYRSYSPETPISAQNRRLFWVVFPLGTWNFTDDPENAQFGKKSAIFCPTRPRNLTDDPEKQHGPFSMLFKLCASFRNHRWILTRVTVRKHRIWLKIGDFFCPVRPSNLTDDLQKNGHLSDHTSSFVHHFVAIGEFTLELQSVNAQFGSKSGKVKIVKRCDRRTDGRRDRRTDWTIHKAAWSQLKSFILSQKITPPSKKKQKQNKTKNPTKQTNKQNYSKKREKSCAREPGRMCCSLKILSLPIHYSVTIWLICITDVSQSRLLNRVTKPKNHD